MIHSREESVLRELDRYPHDFDGENNGIGVSESSEDSEKSEGTENGEPEHDALKNRKDG